MLQCEWRSSGHFSVCVHLTELYAVKQLWEVFEPKKKKITLFHTLIEHDEREKQINHYHSEWTEEKKLNWIARRYTSHIGGLFVNVLLGYVLRFFFGFRFILLCLTQCNSKCRHMAVHSIYTFRKVENIDELMIFINRWIVVMNEHIRLYCMNRDLYFSFPKSIVEFFQEITTLFYWIKIV